MSFPETTPEDLDAWFTYHAPAPATKLLHARILGAYDRAIRELADIASWEDPHAGVDSALRNFARTVLGASPTSADRTRAFNALRLARNCLHEFLHEDAPGFGDKRLLHRSDGYLCEARWLANSSITHRDIGRAK